MLTGILLGGTDFYGLDVCLESTYNRTVPWGFHHRVTLYNSNGASNTSLSFGGPDGVGLSYSGEYAGESSPSGEVYDNSPDSLREKKKCFSTTEEQNNEIAEIMDNELLTVSGPYSATGIGGASCRTYSRDLYQNLRSQFDSNYPRSTSQMMRLIRGY